MNRMIERRAVCDSSRDETTSATDSVVSQRKSSGEPIFLQGELKATVDHSYADSGLITYSLISHVKYGFCQATERSSQSSDLR